MKQKTYEKPAMQVVRLQQQQMLCSSPGARTLGLGSENITWSSEGIEGDDY
jgi:hypothetical protein